MVLKQAIELLARPTGDLVDRLQQLDGRSISTRANQLIFSKLDPLDELFLLVRGWVRLFSGEGEGARTSLLLRAPAVFGDRDILAGCTAAQESAQSIGVCTVLACRRQELEDLFASESLAKNQLTVDLVRRAARTARFADFLSAPLKQRLHWLLWELHHDGERELPVYESMGLILNASAKSVGVAARELQESGELVVKKDRAFSVVEERLTESGSEDFLRLFHGFGAP